ncbi:MAG: RuvX/YqgF family protein [Patescibacteria group bacterium]
MRLLGIDYGTKRVGIALSDPECQFAMPFMTFSNSKTLLQEVIDLAKKNEIKEIILGESRNYKGEANAILEKSLEFKKNLESSGFTVHLEPEFMTSAHVEKLQGKTKTTDESAAALILQSFLDKRKNSA